MSTKIDDYTLLDASQVLAVLADDVRHTRILLTINNINDRQLASIIATADIVLAQVAEMLDNESSRIKPKPS